MTIKLNRSKFGNWPSGPRSKLAHPKLFMPGTLGGGGAGSNYQINQSLRFRASNSAHLSRTPGSTTNRRTFTLSGWYKLGDFNNNFMWGLVANNSGNNDYCAVRANSGDAFAMQFSGRDGVLCDIATTARLRDPTAWYHLVWAIDSTQATAANRVRLYINGVEQTSFRTASYPALNTDFGMNNNVQHYIGRFFSSALYSDGYMAEVNFIDGQQLTPSSFGQTDATTGAWVPRRYTGTYGTNGFYLPFNDAASTTTISQDRSGNGNNWTSSGISVTSGVTFDQMLDTPTNNYAVLSPLRRSQNVVATMSWGNLRAVSPNGTMYARGISTMGFEDSASTGYYCEFTLTTSSSTVAGVGVTTASAYVNDANQIGATNDEWAYAGTGSVNGGYVRNNSVNVLSSQPAWRVSGDVAMIAYKNGKLWFGLNGTWLNSGAPASDTGAQYTGLTGPLFPVCSMGNTSDVVDFNAGQRPFAYTPPTGFVALNTANLSTPTIQRGDDAFAATTRAGSNSQSIITGLRFAPDLVWIKSRNSADNHNLADRVRGTSLNLVSNSSAAEDSVGRLTAFNSDGYTLAGGFGATNANGQNFVDWAWREGAAYGFDIVTYTGDGASTRNISHGLNAVPHMVIVKSRNNVSGWVTKHRSLSSGSVVDLSTTSAQYNAAASNSGGIQDLNSSSVFGTQTGSVNNNNVNTNTWTYVAYLWTSIPGFSLFGSYTGNGSADGPFVWCGFRPRWVMVKRVDTTGNWELGDAARSTFNPTGSPLYPNLSNAESGSQTVDFLSNGFKPRSNNSDNNASGGTYIFAAFAENPFKFANAR